MIQCPRCRHECPNDAVFCARCAARVAAPDDAESLGQTMAMDTPASGNDPGGLGGSRPRHRLNPSRIRRPASSSGAGSAAGHEFPSGTLIADRYRIVGLLGRGGMGEVYRADDLTLGQSVALKFLPQSLSEQDERIERFINEVRIARGVAHPNVCRVYDIGEVEDRVFLSMEFVDGEDLSSLLRRIGRLPQEKAVDIARQLCAGLASLHDREVLHRDLKPANVMLDGRGRVRITDFGLSGLIEEMNEDEIRSGTPSYMAPEQLAGKSISIKSDIYSLGLVLYEIFTGKPVYEAKSLGELRRLHSESTPTSISSVVSDVDPAVERVVLHCLERDPARRPSSAIAVSSALPGGDPVAAALAAGELPSPELVAAAGGEGGIHPLLGLVALLLVIAGLVGYGHFGRKYSLAGYLDMQKPAAVLRDRAQELVQAVGYDSEPVDRAHGFTTNFDILNYLSERDSSRSRWDTLAEHRPAPVVFWYRQSPDYMYPRNPLARIGQNGPPLMVADMVRVRLDSEGRLLDFQAVPPESLAANPDSARVDWDILFEAAALDRSAFLPTEPEWVPPVFAQEQLAWSGQLDDSTTVRVEAGRVGARPSYFTVRLPWTRTERTVRSVRSTSVAEGGIVILVLLVLAGAFYLAQRNLRLGRADLRAATRVAIFVAIPPILAELLSAHTYADADSSLLRVFSASSMGLLFASFCWSLYMALEPYVRRSWPESLIGWSRLVGGRWRDPMVGRSILVGGAFFGVGAMLQLTRESLRALLGAPPEWPQSFMWTSAQAPRVYWASMFDVIPSTLFNGMFFLGLIVFLVILLRRRWIAGLALIAIITLITMAGESNIWLGLLDGFTGGVLFWLVLTRFGLLAFIVGFFFQRLINGFPLTFDFSQPFSGASTMVMVLIVGLTLFGLWSALAGRSFLKDQLHGD